MRRFTAAANRGDLDAVLATFAEYVRFGSVGRIFEGHAGIREFIGDEVIQAGARYRELGVRQAADRTVVEYDFRTGSGGRERFTYACRVRDGLIENCVGRYVD